MGYEEYFCVPWIGKIPSSWNVAPIKRLFDLTSGATPDSGNPVYWDGEICWITPADFQSTTKYVSKGKKCLTEKGYTSCGTRLVPENSIILSK